MRLYDADAELKAISSELDSFDGKKDPIRCNSLVNRLRASQDKVISLLFQLMDECNCERASRDYRMKFPDEILLSEGSESLNGQIWFGAECLSAGSNILNHTKESTMLRPMAKTLTTHLDSLRNDLRDLVIEGDGATRINDDLIKKMVGFDHVFATFEYEYVRTMLPIRTVTEIEKLQEVAVLFSETLMDSLKRGLIKQDDIDEFQPIVMIAIPRLAIVKGLLYKNENPIYTRHRSHMNNLFQPFHGPLYSIRQLLRKLNPLELYSLEKMLSNDQSAIDNLMFTPPSDEAQYNQPSSSGTCNKVSTRDEKSRNGDADLEASVSSENYSNALVDRIQYPIGYARYDSEQSSSVGECNAEMPASSSKATEDQSAAFSSSSNEDAAPSSPTSSPILSNNECNTYERKSNPSSDRAPQEPSSSSLHSSPSSSSFTPIREQEEHQQTANDPLCHQSVSESDAQLAKLMEEFSPSNQESIQHPDAIDTSDLKKTVACSCDISAQSSEPKPCSESSVASSNDFKVMPASTSHQLTDDEALLEEIYLKQTQQLLHKLFVAISGVADQLQSNFASDLRFILRHIFISEIEGSKDDEGNNQSDDDDDDDDDGQDLSDGGDYSSSEQSNSSIPIERGIEAQEVTNLIDLSSSYNVGYDFDPSCYAPSASTVSPYLSSTDINRDPSQLTGPSVMCDPTSVHHSNPANMTNDIYDEEHLDRVNANGSIPRIVHEIDERRQDTMYDHIVSPNEPTIGEENAARRHRQHHASHSVSGRHSRHRNSINEASTISQHGAVSERRHSRHHGGHRSRRSRDPPIWVPDELVVACSCCNSSFTFLRRRHHCRACGQIFCANCSRFTKNLNCWGYNGQVRVCESCYNQP